MHKLISAVFKTLAFIIFLTVFLDTAALVVDVATTTSSILSIANSMQMDISRYNGLPTKELRDMYADAFARLYAGQDVGTMDDKGIITDSSGTWKRAVQDIRVNFTEEDVAEMSTASSDLATILDYGDEQELCVEYDVYMLAFAMPRASLVDMTYSRFKSTVAMRFEVPCLKYTRQERK